MTVVETLIPTAASVQANLERIREQRDLVRARYKQPVRIDGWEFRGSVMAVRWIIGGSPAQPEAGRPASD